MKNFFYFLLGLQLLLTGCNSSQKHDMEKAYCNSNLDSIKVVYFKYRFFIYSKQAAKCSWQTVMNIPNVAVLDDTRGALRFVCWVKVSDDTSYHFYSQRNKAGNITFNINGTVTELPNVATPFAFNVPEALTFIGVT